MEQREGDILVITASDFLPVFRRIRENLDLISAAKEIKTQEQPFVELKVPAELPKKRLFRENVPGVRLKQSNASS